MGALGLLAQSEQLQMLVTTVYDVNPARPTDLYTYILYHHTFECLGTKVHARFVCATVLQDRRMVQSEPSTPYLRIMMQVIGLAGNFARYGSLRQCMFAQGFPKLLLKE